MKTFLSHKNKNLKAVMQLDINNSIDFHEAGY